MPPQYKIAASFLLPLLCFTPKTVNLCNTSHQRRRNLHIVHCYLVLSQQYEEFFIYHQIPSLTTSSKLLLRIARARLARRFLTYALLLQRYARLTNAINVQSLKFSNCDY